MTAAVCVLSVVTAAVASLSRLAVDVATVAARSVLIAIAVRTATPGFRLLVVAAVAGVVSLATFKVIFAFAAGETVVSEAAVDEVVAVIAAHTVIAVITQDFVVPFIALERVVVGSSVEQIIAQPAGKHIRAVIATDLIAAAIPCAAIVTRSAVQDVVVIAAAQLGFKTAIVERASESILEQLLPVLDSFDAALVQLSADTDPALRKGVELVFAQMVGVLERAGLERIDADGRPFDPNEHEAVLQEDGDGEPVVAETMRTGYRLKGRVLRPAMVKVAR